MTPITGDHSKYLVGPTADTKNLRHFPNFTNNIWSYLLWSPVIEGNPSYRVETPS